MSIKSFQDFHMLNEGKKLKDWQYTGTVSVGSNNAIYYQYPNNVKYYVSVTPEEFEDYLEGGSLKKKLEKQWAASGKAMNREEFEAKYMPKGPQGLGKYLSQGGRMWDHVESSEDDMYVEAARSWELMETSHIKHEVRKIMKLAKNRPAPFSVVAIKDGKVIAQDIDIKIWQSILAHYREMAKAHPDAKIHVEDADGQSVMESVNEAKSPSIVVTINKSNSYYNDGPRDLSGWYAKEFSEYLFGSKYNLQVTDLGKDQFTLEFIGKGLSNIDSKVDDYVNRLNNAWKGEGLKISLDESVNEGSGTIAKGAYSFADYFGIPVSRLKGFKFDGTDDVEELHKVLGRASSNIKGTENIYKVSITESVDRSNFNQLAYLSSVEYQKVKKLKNFNAADWKWDSKKDLYKNVRIEESVNEDILDAFRKSKVKVKENTPVRLGTPNVPELTELAQKALKTKDVVMFDYDVVGTPLAGIYLVGAGAKHHKVGQRTDLNVDGSKVQQYVCKTNGGLTVTYETHPMDVPSVFCTRKDAQKIWDLYRNGELNQTEKSVNEAVSYLYDPQGLIDSALRMKWITRKEARRPETKQAAIDQQKEDAEDQDEDGDFGSSDFSFSLMYFMKKLGHKMDVKGGRIVKVDESVNEAGFSFTGLMNDINKKQQAAMDARKAYTNHDGYSKTYKMGKKLDDLYAYRSMIMQDMEQESEPEGGQIADQYGKQLNDLDSKISKLEDAINTIGDRERELEKKYQAAMDALKQARLVMKSAMQNESLDEAGGTIAKGAYSFADYFGIPVSRLKGFKFDGTDDVEELHKVLGRASSNIKGTENIYKASITESADMLPSFEVIAGLATVLGALDLAQAVKGGNSIIVDVTKALKAELGDRLEATGTEAKRVIDKFKGNSKVKEIIMDAEEEVNESKKSTIMKISLFEEYFNEGKKDYAARYNGVDINLKNGYKYLKDHELEDLYTKIGKLLKGKTTMAKRVDVVFESVNEEYFNEAKSDVTPGSRVEVTGKSIGNMGKTLQGEVTRKNSNGTYEVSLDNGDMADYKADELKLIESVNESRLMGKYGITESINEATETGLMVVPRTNADANKIQKWVDKSDMHGEWDAKEGYFLFPEEEDGFDELEMELTKELDKLGVNYRIEGVFESMRQETAKIKLFEDYFNEAAPMSSEEITKLKKNMPGYIGPKFAQKASDEDIQLMVDLKNEKALVFNQYIKPINDKIVKLLKKYRIPHKATGIEESLDAEGQLNESTHAAFGIIDKEGKISSAYIHADGYPDHMIPIIKKYFKTGKAVQSVVDKGGASQLDKPSNMNFYNDEPDTPKTRGTDTMDANKISNYLKFAGNNYGAEFIYLYDDRDGNWKYATYKDDELRKL